MSQTEPNFQFRGTKEAKGKLKQIFRLLLSVPSGHSVISGVVKSRSLAKKRVWWLSHPHVSISLTESLRGVAGMTDITFNKIELSCFAADGHNMLRQPTPTDDILMAATLGHELRHIMTRYAYLSLMMYAQTKSEMLLAKLLQEEDAWFMGDRIESELYANADDVPVRETLKKRIRKYYGEEGRLRHLKDVLNGELEWTLYEVAAAKRQRKFLRTQKNPDKTKMFKELVEVWLKGMNLPISTDEVMQSPILQIKEEEKRPNLIHRLFRRGAKC